MAYLFTKNVNESFYVILYMHKYHALIIQLFYLSFGSDGNLQNDHYLISLMDDQGWVPISIIADFKRVFFFSVQCFYIYVRIA